VAELDPGHAAVGGSTIVRSTYDVAILGGGLAGLTLGLQLARGRPQTSILIAEKRDGIAPEAAFKVGESTVELSAYYFAEVCGMKDHLERAELPKNGLRFFFPADGNEDIAQRAEWGTVQMPPTPSYQLDRGRFENELTERNRAREGTDVLAGWTAQDVDLSPDGHRVTIAGGGAQEQVEARWVIDTTGPAQLLKRKLGLGKPVKHTINASWLRLRNGLDIEDWSDDERWLGRMAAPGLRKLSTNHLMGQGYWVWLIPLASGSISIGIVADPRYHPFEEISTLDAALGWLGRHEPQLGRDLERRRDEIEDFLKAKDFAYSCQRVYSPERWALSGIAGCFLDPFYSPGSDHIAVSNTFITDLVTRDLDGDHDPERVEALNGLFLRFYEGALPLYEGMYEVWGDPLVMSAKLGWDYSYYWSVNVPRFMHGKWHDLPFLGRTLDLILRGNEVKSAVEALFLEWHRRRDPDTRGGFAPYASFDGLFQLSLDLDARYDDDTLAEKLRRNLEFVEAVAVLIFHKAAECLGDRAPDPEARIDPAKLTLDPDRYEERGLIGDVGLTLGEARAIAPGIEVLWFEQATTL
jgi:flavin-dependent dehydrogenase